MSNPLISASFRRSFAMLVLMSTASASIAGGFSSFADALEQRGWHIDRHVNGDILLFPRPDQQRATAPAPRSEHEHLDALAGRLAATGWQVQRSSDGGVLFWAGDRPQAPAASHPRDGLIGLGERLAAAGWQVERGTDGSLMFRAADKTGDRPQAPAASHPRDRLAGLGERLAAAGWQVERGTDGSLMFWADHRQPFRPGPAPAHAAASMTVTPCRAACTGPGRPVPPEAVPPRSV